MAVEFKTSQTKENLLKAFAGESQARNRYTIAAEEAKNQKLHVVEAVFQFTADQERAHAKVFYDFLKDVAGENIQIDGAYPVDLSCNVSELLKMAQHNEYEEHDDVYVNFANKAKEEGFPQIASAFTMIAAVEKIHGDRFGYLGDLLAQNKLFISDVKTGWMCLECGYVYEGTEAPKTCPVCKHDQGFFIRLELAPYEKIPQK